MDTASLPVFYLSILVGLLGILAILLLREIIKTRRIESTYDKLRKKLQKEPGTAKEYYELGSLYLDKKLHVQAAQLLKKALKDEDELEAENKALIYNALGYAYFAQEQYDLAIRQYKAALKALPDYPTALNNLANIYEKKQLTAKALETYEKVLETEPENKTAKKRAESLRKRFATSS
ncbi:Tetratricopeptide TPR_1 repeat-containing protein [[Leptolyngbya] sp. PCC 7376]|uniref:tetratricopeptide repeat protein n=1 Tax=[Leptolyngbya] sp. PCC 7376 TaxID=111781 RepID=UPI00029EE9E6|nr:tetratricopeptide repeat protein [[Leptolyngbya] sp. PCC 7376]AFY37208.1 Tetratricopeptide TPR_1 repeat-containing protein [[Leptolyngbya] sp. PCC 7376]